MLWSAGPMARTPRYGRMCRRDTWAPEQRRLSVLCRHIASSYIS
jgi:hypothetical protein